MTPSEALTKIKALAKVSFDNGDSPENVEAAAKQIGHLVMTFPDILDPPARASDSARSSDSQRSGSSNARYRDNDGGYRDSGSRGESRGYDRDRAPAKSANGTKRENKYVTFNHEAVVREQPNAVLFKIKGNEVWIPRSQMEGFTKTTVTMTEWIANHKHLLDNEG